MSKYGPLLKFLGTLEKTEWPATFGEVETILGFSLPPSAYHYPAWWANDAKGHSHAAAWLDAGWRTRDIDIPGRRLTLVRDVPLNMSGTRFGCMKGSAWLATDVDLTAPLGGETAVGQGRLTGG